ncbi:MAG: type III-A CRISPR-associated RAMP protein Csm5 [Deltaproteobacteria bacterium]|nr:MAG: type III-A CRISPR-associated RAMP protein Csm5 [Deltaproteobacteria bacterium]
MTNEPICNYHCAITILSPVHVGSGEKYIKDLDYIIENKTVFIFSRPMLFSLLESVCDEKDIEDLTESISDRRLKEWLSYKGVDYKNAIQYKYPIKGNQYPKDIHQAIKNAWGVPIIPGSSVKGAIRTAILRDLSEKDERRTLKKVLTFALRKRRFTDNELKGLDQGITEELLGKDPNHNLMRTLSVGDFIFQRDALTLSKVVVKTIKGNGKLEEKVFKIYPEVLRTGAVGESNVGIETFLFEQDRKKENKIFGFSSGITLSYIRNVANHASLKIVEEEIAYFENQDEKLANFYKDLRKQIQELSKSELITRISWGVGWRSITGGLIPEDLLTKQLREILKLAPKKWPARFPKTRKIVQTPAGNLPLGWIKLSFRAMEEVREEEKKKRAEEAARVEKQAQIRAEEERKKREEEERKAYLESLSPEERDIEMIKEPSVSEQQVVEIYRKIDEFSEANKKKLAEALKDYWIQHNKWKGKLSHKQKQKVAKIKEILEAE